jgi:hypothetical protein
MSAWSEYTRGECREERCPVQIGSPGCGVVGVADYEKKYQKHSLAPKRKIAAQTPVKSGASVAAFVAPYRPTDNLASITQSRGVRFGDKVLACLLADAQLPDHIAVAVRVVGLQVIQQATALAYQHQ